MSYDDFLSTKAQLGDDSGFEPLWMPDFLFDFQAALVEWALLKGRGAIFADCGLGKTPMQLVWAENVVRKTNRPVLIVTPLAVSSQTVHEGQKFGIEVKRSSGAVDGAGIYVTNYERLHHFQSSDFAGLVCDESSILKSFDGVTRAAITEFMRLLPYRLLCTATAAPNDYIELGTSSEALGYLGHMDMLGRFFKKDDTMHSWMGGAGRRYYGSGGCYRFKGHAETPFWRWVCSWARALRRPSDFGFDDAKFALPELIEREHIVKANVILDGMLFSMPAVGLAEQREERRRTLTERCERAAELATDETGPVVSWCQLNDEGDLLEKLIPDAIQVSGRDSDESKEAKFTAFSEGTARVLVTKPIIGAWGLNWQHCARMTCFASHSFEQYYQSVRRCWRFGQTRPVIVDNVVSDGEQGVLRNLQRKSAQSDVMFTELVAHMNEQLGIRRGVDFDVTEEVPEWLCSINA